MIANYSIVSETGVSVDGAIVNLCKEVRHLMGHGWQPLGAATYLGCFYSSGAGENRHVFCQTLVKEASVGDKPS